MFGILKSLKFALVLLGVIILALVGATLLESKFDTQVAMYYVYDANWFFLLFYLLALNILVVALSRYPWRKKHIPFLLAHSGILVLLIAAWWTKRFGIDAHMRLSEKEVSNTITLPANVVWVQRAGQIESISLHYLPPFVAFKPIFLPKSKIWIKQYVTHADSKLFFHAHPQGVAAVHLKVLGGPMGLNHDLWLWEGSSSWQAQQLGPAHFSLGKALELKAQEVGLEIYLQKDQIKFVSLLSDGTRQVQVVQSNDIIGESLDVGWKGGVRIRVLNILQHAMPEMKYFPSQQQFGADAPPSAIEVVFSEKLSSQDTSWLGLGSSVQAEIGAEKIEVGFVSQELQLPFSLELKDFEMLLDPGTKNPAAYASWVQVLDESHSFERYIRMNEPLKYKGYTVYQASYEPQVPKVVTSIFSINRDPARLFKYLGSGMIVLGSFLLFWQKLALGRRRVFE